MKWPIGIISTSPRINPSAVLVVPEQLKKSFVSRLSAFSDRVVRQRTELAWVMVGQVLTFLGGFAGIKLLTNAMGSEGYGRLALGMTLAGLLNMFIYGPMGQVVSRYFSIYRERGDLDVYFFVLKKAHIAAAALLILCTVAAGVLVRRWWGVDWALLVVAALLFGMVGGVNSSFLALQTAIRQRKIVALHQAADTWARPVLAIFGLWVLGNGAPSAFVGFMAGTLLIVLSQGVCVWRSPRIRGHWQAPHERAIPWQPASREYFAYASPFILFAGFAATSMYADRWVLQGLFGESEVGIYTALYQIGSAPVTFLMGLISQLAVPIIFERAGAMTQAAQAQSSSQLLRQVVIVSAILLVPIVTAAYFFGEPLVRILTNTAFSKSSDALWIIVSGIALFNIGQLLSIKGQNYGRPAVYLFPKAAQALSFLLLMYLLAGSHGLIGVAMALSGSSLLYLLMVVSANRRLTMVVR